MIQNKTLLQQIKSCGLSTEPLSENMTKLLHCVSGTYADLENEKSNFQNIVSLCSSEMIDLNSKLKKESNQLKNLFETMREVFFSLDMETGKLIQISQACETVYGYPAEDFIKNPSLWIEIVNEKDKDVIEHITGMISTGRPFTFCYRINRKDGCIRWMETQITPTLNDQGRAARLDGFTADVTTRKEALNLLLKSE